MAHYVCPECGGKSDVPKMCGTEGCARNGEPLQECNCVDGQHSEVKGADKESLMEK